MEELLVLLPLMLTLLRMRRTVIILMLTVLITVMPFTMMNSKQSLGSLKVTLRIVFPAVPVTCAQAQNKKHTGNHGENCFHCRSRYQPAL